MAHSSRRVVLSSRCAFTLIELLAVVIVLAILVGVLLPVLSTARKSQIAKSLTKESQYGYGPQAAAMNKAATSLGGAPPQRPLALVKSFDAHIDLTPKLSIGTAEPESIYEAKFTAKLQATQPGGPAPSTKPGGDCEVLLPLPPQLISLADLAVTVNGESSENVFLRDGKLVWRGTLAGPAPMEFTYTAVGKGLYSLEVPPGGIVDSFQATLVANGSDVRMLEMSLQPTSLSRASGATTYNWNYKRLMMGLPIELDVLGIAPIDRLGELSWLGPISVVVFGMLVGLVARAWDVQRMDRWMLLLIIGTFTGAYPLMYFAQQFVSLRTAIVGSAGAAMLIIGIRTVTMMRPMLAVVAIVLPGIAIMSLTLKAAVDPHLQGILLTVEAMGFFILCMSLMPRLAPAKRATLEHRTDEPRSTPAGSAAAATESARSGPGEAPG